MLPKAHLTSHSKMSGSKWVITPLWLSGLLRSFLYSSSVYSCLENSISRGAWWATVDYSPGVAKSWTWLNDSQGNISCKQGKNKEKKWQGSNRTEEIKKRWQEYTEELYKKGLNDPDNHNSVITHLEPDILECEVKWGLGSITRNKASGGDGIPVELFQILKDYAVKMLHSICW